MKIYFQPWHLLMHAQQNCVSVKPLLSRLSACLGLMPPHLIQSNMISSIATQQPCIFFEFSPTFFLFTKGAKHDSVVLVVVRPFMVQEDFWTSQSISDPLVRNPLGTVCNPTASHCVLHAWHVLISFGPLIRRLNSGPVEGFSPRLQTIYADWVTLFHW